MPVKRESVDRKPNLNDESDSEDDIPLSKICKSVPLSGTLEHLPISSIVREVNALVEGPPLAFPSCTSSSTFATHDQLRIFALAAALQQGFSIYIRTTMGSSAESASGKDFYLACTRSDPDRNKDNKQCGMFILAHRHRHTGRWRVTKEHLEHSHELANRVLKLPVTRTSKKEPKRKITSRSSSPEVDRPSPSPSGSSIDTSREPSTVASVGTSLSRASTFTDASNITPENFLSSLQSFLVVFAPALESIAPTLLSKGGLDSIEAIVTLLNLSDDVLDMWVSSLKLNKLQEMTLKKAVRDARRRTGEELSGRAGRRGGLT